MAPSARFLSNILPPLLLLFAIGYVINSSAKLSETAGSARIKAGEAGGRLANTLSEWSHDLGSLASGIGSSDTRTRPKYYDDDESDQFDLTPLKNTIGMELQTLKNSIKDEMRQFREEMLQKYEENEKQERRERNRWTPTSRRRPKVLYWSRHDGTIANFGNVAKQLDLDYTDIKPGHDYGIIPDCVKKEECGRIVEALCESYDFIVISDTIPDSRTWLFPWCRTKIVLEITNRFDYGVPGHEFRSYYHQIDDYANNHDNVIMVVNNPYEVLHTCLRGVILHKYALIRPTGFSPPITPTPEQISPSNRNIMAILARGENDKKHSIPAMQKLGVPFKAVDFPYGGPTALASYKCLLYLPYQVSVMGFFENLRAGVVYLLPTVRFFEKILDSDPGYDYWGKDLLHNRYGPHGNWAEWWRPEFKDALLFYDSWEEIPKLLDSVDFDKQREKAKSFMAQFEKTTLDQWREIFGLIKPKGNMFEYRPAVCNRTIFGENVE